MILCSCALCKFLYRLDGKRRILRYLLYRQLSLCQHALSSVDRTFSFALFTALFKPLFKTKFTTLFKTKFTTLFKTLFKPDLTSLSFCLH